MDNGWKKYNKQPQVWGCEIGYTPSVITRMIQLTPPAKVDCPDGADGIESLTVTMASPLAATSHLDVNSMVVSTRDLPSKLLRILSSQLAIEMSQLYRYTIS